MSPERICSPARPVSRVRIVCQGAAARKVATISIRASPSSRPGREGRGRPRRLPLRAAPVPSPRPARAFCAARCASRSSGSSARMASSSISSGRPGKPSSGFWASSPVSGSGGSGVASSGSAGGGGTRVARWASVRAQAAVRSSSETWSRPISRAWARAARRAKSTARALSMPQAAATVAICATCAGVSVTGPSVAVCGGGGDVSPKETSVSSMLKASRSVRVAGGASSSVPSSSRIRARGMASRCCASWAASAGGQRSAIVSSSGPGRDSSPGRATMRPAASVAVRSRPPCSASSAIAGCRRTAAGSGSASRTGPDRARMRMPPSPGSMASRRRASRA